MSTSIKCSNCSKEYIIPNSSRFLTSCTCGMQIFRNTTDGILFQCTKPKQVEPSSKTPVERIGKGLEKFLLWSLPIAGILLLIVLGLGQFGRNENNRNDVINEVPVSNLMPVSNASSTDLTTTSPTIVTTYSGNCTQYKLTLVNRNQKKYTPITKAFAKITIDHINKKFTFIFNGKVVYTYSRFESYRDNERGVEGFTFGGNWSAMRSHSAGTFTVYNSYFGDNSGDLGYEYEITNYKLN